MLDELYLLRTELRSEAAEAYGNAMRLAEQLGDASRLSSCHANLGRLYIAAQPGDSLYDRWQEGVAHYRKAAELAHEAGDEFNEMGAKYELATLYMHRQHPYEALPLLQETKDFQFRTFPDQKGATLFSLIMVFLQLDRPDSAQVYIDQALALPARQNNIRYRSCPTLPLGRPTPSSITNLRLPGSRCLSRWRKSRRSMTMSNSSKPMPALAGSAIIAS